MDLLSNFSLDNKKSCLRILPYLLSEDIEIDHRISRKGQRQVDRLMKPIHKDILTQELASLPPEQCLLTKNHFQVYYGYYDQIPETVKEIGRLREKTFRVLNEGSGLSCDTDRFDQTYTHLFIWNNASKEIIGAYRMGQTDRLLAEGDITQLYLSSLFHYTADFLSNVYPGLEMGRSFIIPKYQRTFYGLLLLWKGIGAFLVKFPHYHTLFGTVSISTTYSPASIALMKEVLVGDKFTIQPINMFHCRLHSEVKNYIKQYGLSIEELSQLIKIIEPDHKNLPILIKQYMKLGARFHSIALDKGFNNTPGVLLTVRMPEAQPKFLQLFLGKHSKNYLAYDQAAGHKHSQAFCLKMLAN
ncbi:MAG: GNAT family N-acyltransferase [Desulfobacterales bacterium]